MLTSGLKYVMVIARHAEQGKSKSIQCSIFLCVLGIPCFMELRGRVNADSNASRREFSAFGRQRGGALHVPAQSSVLAANASFAFEPEAGMR
jgi:hypothetical protein